MNRFNRLEIVGRNGPMFLEFIFFLYKTFSFKMLPVSAIFLEKQHKYFGCVVFFT